MKVCIIEGPLLDKAGSREPGVYGGVYTRNDLEQLTGRKAAELGVDIEFISSYSEGELAKMIADCICDGLILNPGAYTHTSILIRDAVLCSGTPFVEAHLSNIFGRENFRRQSFLNDIAAGVVCGFGLATYAVALEGICALLKKKELNSLKLDKNNPQH